ncbi:MAG: EAL domain-containing protein, partial [Gammaproteobacteria bacterium]|nr:EAL domain-containing protein [Gammaproteobacteria bacterium]
TGYSSLSYLKRFPFDVLKIDQSFVRDIGKNQDDTALCEAIIAMAHSLGLGIIAEGVETKEQFDFLRARGTETLQGYYMGKPADFSEFKKVLGCTLDHC